MLIGNGEDTDVQAMLACEVPHVVRKCLRALRYELHAMAWIVALTRGSHAALRWPAQRARLKTCPTNHDRTVVTRTLPVMHSRKPALTRQRWLTTDVALTLSEKYCTRCQAALQEN